MSHFYLTFLSAFLFSLFLFIQSNDFKFIKIKDVTLGNSDRTMKTTVKTTVSVSGSTVPVPAPVPVPVSVIAVSSANTVSAVSPVSALNTVSVPPPSVAYSDVLMAPDWLSITEKDWLFFGPATPII